MINVLNEPGDAWDALVVACRGNGEELEVHSTGLDEQQRLAAEALLRAVEASAGPWETTVVPGLGGVVIGVGLGPDRTDLARHEVLRRAAGAAARAARSRAVVHYALPTRDRQDAIGVLEGALLGGYAYGEYQSKAKPLATTTIAVLGSSFEPSELDRARAVTDAVAFCRDLVNTPPGDLRPSALTERVAAMAADAGLDMEVLDADRLAEQGYGGIVGVGQGSSDPPRLIRLSYRHPEARRHLALVGKGITFDSGGLSLKPPPSMMTMKLDMSGAAAVAAAMLAISRLQPRANITGWLAVAENMPSGTAQRPGDVVRTHSGKTVEVLNTDAEGRLVLADALSRAAEEAPDAIVDIATLTGAQMIALGPSTAGVMGSLRDAVCSEGAAAGESLWPMPLPPELRSGLDSPVADLRNIGDGPNGGMLLGGLFLQEFVPQNTPWAHLDIAGPAFNTSGAYGYTPKGGTGFGVRTLVALAEALAQGRLLA